MDILTLVIVMGQGVADIVVFGKPLFIDQKSFTDPQALLKLSMYLYLHPYTYRKYELINSTRARYRREAESWLPKASSGA
jgi:hypothetical protein